MIFANRKVACAVPEVKGVQTQIKKGFAIASNQSTLCELQVVFESEFQPGVNLYPGSKIWVTTEAVTSDPWTRKIYTVNGIQFVLVLVDIIQAYEPSITVGGQKLDLASGNNSL